MNKILICIIIISLNVFSQSRLQSTVGIMYPVLPYGNESEVYRFWKLGLNAGVNVDIQLSKEFSLRPTIDYHYLLFDHYVQEVFAGSEVIDSEGKGSQILAIRGDLIVSRSRSDNSNLFIVLGSGYVVERTGKMTITWQENASSNHDIYSTEYQLKRRNYWNYTAGFGYDYSFAQDIGLKMTIKYSINRSDPSSLSEEFNSVWLLNCSLFYDIIDL